jgi:hypothetical protein
VLVYVDTNYCTTCRMVGALLSHQSKSRLEPRRNSTGSTGGESTKKVRRKRAEVRFGNARAAAAQSQQQPPQQAPQQQHQQRARHPLSLGDSAGSITESTTSLVDSNTNTAAASATLQLERDHLDVSGNVPTLKQSTKISKHSVCPSA